MSAQISPCIYYRDAPAGLAFLKAAFGFKEVVVMPGPKGTIAHCELGIDGSAGTVMLGSENPEKKRLSPGGSCSTSAIYVGGLQDTEALFQQAKKAGAKITMDIMTTDYGSRDFSAEDPEGGDTITALGVLKYSNESGLASAGHVWHFGTYLPEAGKAT